MDEIWEKAIETALNGETDCYSVRSLTLDGAVKCFQLRFPPPSLLEKFENLQHLSVANAGVCSLENFPHLPNLQKLVLSDNRISGGLEFLSEARLHSLRDLDLSNNRFQYVEDLTPLSHLKLQSLDLYECPVTKIDNYRSSVFKLIRSLKYLDKMDAEENERSESEDEEDDEDDDEEEEEEDEPGSGEVAPEHNPRNTTVGSSIDGDTVLEIDEDEESDTDEEDREMVVIPNGFIPSHHHSNGFRVASARAEEDDDGDDEVDGRDDDVVEVHEIDDSENSDAIEEDEDDDGDEEDDDEDDDDEDADEVEDEEDDDVEALSIGRVTSEGEIDGHDHGEEDDENGEIGEEEELSIDEDGKYEADEVEDEDGTEFLVQPIGHPEEEEEEEEDVGGINFDEDDDSEQEEVDDEGIQGGSKLQLHDPSTSSLQAKRKRNKVEDANAGEEEEEDDGVQNGEVQFHPSTSQIKRKRNGEEEEDDADSEDEDDISVEDKFRRHH